MEWKTDTVLDSLIGRTVDAVKVSDKALCIHSQGIDVIVDVHADCCSESWWADITGVENILGKVITNIEEADLRDYDLDDGRGRQESDQAYGFRLRSSDGAAIFVYRNSSNGYYGGWMASVNGELPKGDYESVESKWKSPPQES